MKSGRIVLGALLLAAAAAEAQVDVQASVSRDTIALNESVEYRVSVTGAGLREVEEPRLGLPLGLTLFGRSRSSEVSIVNGGATRRTTFTLVYRPFRVGRTIIGPATIRAGGDVLRVPPVDLEVVAERPPGAGGVPSLGVGPAAPPLGALLPPPFPEADVDSTLPPALAGARELPAVFVTNRLDKDEAYVGEQVVLTFAFYQSPRAMVLDQPNYASAKTPGFWTQDFNREPEIAREFVGGEPFTIQRFHYALFPLTPGKKDIAPATLTLTLRNPVSFLDRGRTRTLSGDTLTLRVKPLPAEERPDDFSGAVGRYRLSARVEPRDPERDAPVTLVVTVAGEGNLATLSPPRLETIEGIKAFDPEVRIRTSGRGLTIGGEKEFRYLLVPQRAGAVDLGGASLSFFDPEAGEYTRAIADLGALAVRPPAGYDPANRGSGETMLAGIRRGEVGDATALRVGSTAFWALLAFPLVGLGLLARLRRRPAPPRRRAAEPRFPDPERLRELPHAAGVLQLERELVSWLEARHGLVLSGQSVGGRERALRTAGVPAETAAAAGRALRALESAAFAPPGAGAAALAEALEALRALRAAEHPGRPRAWRRPRVALR
ncbi:MAG: BatD family protein [Gemmatimonadota bacterium]